MSFEANCCFFTHCCICTCFHDCWTQLSCFYWQNGQVIYSVLTSEAGCLLFPLSSFSTPHIPTQKYSDENFSFNIFLNVCCHTLHCHYHTVHILEVISLLSAPTADSHCLCTKFIPPPHPPYQCIPSLKSSSTRFWLFGGLEGVTGPVHVVCSVWNSPCRTFCVVKMKRVEFCPVVSRFSFFFNVQCFRYLSSDLSRCISLWCFLRAWMILPHYQTEIHTHSVMHITTYVAIHLSKCYQL
jgi:hypothetical protein